MVLGGSLSIQRYAGVDAAVQLWYGGQETGHGLTDVLWGRVNPTGRLPLTIHPSAYGFLLFARSVDHISFTAYSFSRLQIYLPFFVFG